MEEFEKQYCAKSDEDEKENLVDTLKYQITCKNFSNKFTKLFPITLWLYNYSFRANFHGDLVTGLTVGIMVVPQGMAYATLAGLSPIYGLYSCFFAALIYMFFGTSKHVSIGTFAVASMMVGVVQNELLNDKILNPSKNENEFVLLSNNHNGTSRKFDFELTPIVITTSLTFYVGVFQLIMGFCRLSFLTNYISDPLVSGFTTGSAVHVLYSQLSKVFGVHIKQQSGFYTILKMTYELIAALPHANPWTLCITAFGLIFLSIGRDYVNPWFKIQFRILLPLELFLVIISIIFSLMFDVNQQHNVNIVANVPQGLPLPSLPKFELFSYLWTKALSISVICYIFVFSMGKIFAKKHKYKIDSNQEFYALGIAEVLSSFFPVYPSGASLSRSSLCEMTGAKTQLHALFSSGILLIVIIWLGPMLEPLPMATLACIVIISLKSLFLQCKELPRLWRISLADFTVWTITFLITTFVDVIMGLLVGIVSVIFSIVLREQWPSIQRLNTTPQKDIFRPSKKYSHLLPTIDFGRTIILKFNAPLHFANTTKFVEQCENALSELGHRMTPELVLTSEAFDLKRFSSISAAKKKAESISSVKNSSEVNTLEKRHVTPFFNPMTKSTDGSDDSSMISSFIEPKKTTLCQIYVNEFGNTNKNLNTSTNGTLIIEASSISFIDSSGVEALCEIYNDALRLFIEVKFAEFSDSVLSVLQRCQLFQVIPKTNFYPTTREAFLSVAVADNTLLKA